VDLPDVGSGTLIPANAVWRRSIAEMTDQEIGDAIERDATALQLGHIELKDVVEPVPDFETHLHILLAGTQGVALGVVEHQLVAADHPGRARRRRRQASARAVGSSAGRPPRTNR